MEGIHADTVALIMSNHLGYCEGAAIACLARWCDAGNVNVVRQAARYVQILLEDRDYQHRLEDRCRLLPIKDSTDGAEYCVANGITGDARMAIQSVYLFAHRGWRSLLEEAARYIDDIIAEELAQQ